MTGEIGLLALAATGGEDRGATVTGEIGLLALAATGGKDHGAPVTGEIGLLALAATGGEDRGATVTGEIGLLALAATGGKDHGATVLWNCSWPPLTAMMVAGLEALRSLSRVVIPLAPEKFLVAAMASRSFGPSVTPDRLMASTRM